MVSLIPLLLQHLALYRIPYTSKSLRKLDWHSQFHMEIKEINSRIAALFLAFLFPFISFSQALDSSHLPIVVINTNGNEIQDEPKILVQMGIINNASGTNHLTDPFNGYEGHVGIEFRGNSTQGFDKKSYSVETRDANGNDINAALLGMPAEEDWILYGSPIDKTHIRNVLSFELWRKMGYWASRTRYCELVLNGDYRGTYVLMEKVKRDSVRLDIAKLRPDEIKGDDLTGGYLIRMDWPEAEGWWSKYNSMGGESLYYQFSYPKAENIASEQKLYIRQYIKTFEDALFSPSFFNQSGQRYSELIDISTFADLFIINELSRSVDAYKISSYIHKDKDSKGGLLKAGPVWDFNLAYGNTAYCGGAKTAGWTYLQRDQGCDDLFLMPLWWERMMEDCEFRDTLYNRWTRHRDSFLNEAFLFSFIDEQTERLGPAIERNFDRWDHLGDNLWDDPEPIPSTYAGEIERLKEWLSKRIAWLDRQLEGECIPPDPILINSGGVLVFPNPFTESISIQLEEQEEAIVELFDITGRLLRQIDMEDTEILLNNLAGLAAGVYIIRLSKGEFMHVEKIVKQ